MDYWRKQWSKEAEKKDKAEEEEFAKCGGLCWLNTKHDIKFQEGTCR